MSIKTKIYFCMGCTSGGLTREKITHTDCHEPFFIVEADVAFNLRPRTRWGRFLNWFYSLDFSYGIAFMGAITMNAILLPHLDLSFKTQLLESFCLGCVLVRLLK